jgi:hypothetical protein
MEVSPSMQKLLLPSSLFVYSQIVLATPEDATVYLLGHDWSFVVLGIGVVMIVNDYTLNKWYLRLLPIIFYAIPSSLVAAFILEQIDSLEVYDDAMKHAQAWELLLTATIMVEVVLLFVSELAIMILLKKTAENS